MIDKIQWLLPQVEPTSLGVIDHVMTLGVFDWYCSV